MKKKFYKKNKLTKTMKIKMKINKTLNLKQIKMKNKI